MKTLAVNGWKLFWLISIAMSVAIIHAMTQVDLAVPWGTSAMIQFTVRCAVPCLYIAFAASSLATLFPNRFTRWLVRNRKIFGLCFATGMAWQLAFIVWLVGGYLHYYLEFSYSPVDLLLRLPAYVLLTAMAITSFRYGRGKISDRQWHRLHTIGIYFLWGTVWSTYWYELHYHNDIQFIDYVYYWAGLAAWGLRILSWISVSNTTRSMR